MNYFIGLDIGGTKCAAVLGDCGEEIAVLDKERFETAGLTPSEVLERFSAFIAKHAQDKEIKGIGVSYGGPLNGKKGIVFSSPSLPLWDKIEVVKYFEEKFSIPTRLQSEANAGALAEWKYGAGKGCNDVIFLTCGTGFSAGIVSGGRLLVGANGNIGEIGNVRLAKTGPVGDGKEGSAEGYCSGNGIKRLAELMYYQERKKGKKVSFFEEHPVTEVDAKVLAEGARSGDSFCKKVFKASGEKLGEALAILIDLFNPQVIAIGGVFTRYKDLLYPHAKAVIAKEALPLSLEVCKVVPAALDENIGDISALAVATGEY